MISNKEAARRIALKEASQTEANASLTSEEKANSGTKHVVFLGNPNVGKSSIFNIISGSRSRVVNAPGTTVLVERANYEYKPKPRSDKKSAAGASSCANSAGLANSAKWELLDTPGTYSLLPLSPDEEVASQAAFGIGNYPVPDAIVAVLDSTNLSRSLYFLSMIIELGRPVVVALTMNDLAKKRGIEIDVKMLSELMNGIPVVAVNGRTGSGKDALLEAVNAAFGGTAMPKGLSVADFAGLSARRQSGVSTQSGASMQSEPQGAVCRHCNPTAKNSAKKSAKDPAVKNQAAKNSASENLAESASESVANPSNPLNPAQTSNPAQTLQTSQTPQNPQTAQISDLSVWVESRAEKRFDWVANIIKKLDLAAQDKQTLSDRIDRVLLHPVFGLLFFFAAMYGVFWSVTELSKPFADWFGGPFSDWLISLSDRLFDSPGGDSVSNGSVSGGSAINVIHSLFENGLIGGIVTVGTFIPPMLIMFLILSILEDCGYLARAGFVMDRLMRCVGLDGRAFLPLITGFGCNLPALASTRILPDSRQRLLTGMLIPFTSCSARFSVYFVLAHAVFPEHAAPVIFSLYVLSIVLILLIGLGLRKFAFNNMKPQPFVLCLPAYQTPRALVLIRSTFVRLLGFMRGASVIIIATITIMWLLQSIPVPGRGGSFAEVEDVHDSIYGVVADSVSSAFAPAGFGDWHMSAALISGFVAKEVVVGSIAQSYDIDYEEDEKESEENEQPAESEASETENAVQEDSIQGSEAQESASQEETAQKSSSRAQLSEAIRSSLDRSSSGHPKAAGFALMLFVLAYTPCLATVAEMKRQFGLKTAVANVALSLSVAYLLAVAVFWGLRLIL